MIMNKLFHKINTQLALAITIGFGTMWCVYVFLLFSLLPIFAPSMETTALYISNCVQLVALPAIMVGSAVLAKSANTRAEKDHLVLLEILHTLRAEVAELKKHNNSVPKGESD
jgi:uncharacterized protein YhhL (DUF1145 family)